MHRRKHNLTKYYTTSAPPYVSSNWDLSAVHLCTVVWQLSRDFILGNLARWRPKHFFQRLAKVVKSENTQVKIGNSLFNQVGIVDYVVAIRCDRG